MYSPAEILLTSESESDASSSLLGPLNRFRGCAGPLSLLLMWPPAEPRSAPSKQQHSLTPPRVVKLKLLRLRDCDFLCYHRAILIALTQWRDFTQDNVICGGMISKRESFRMARTFLIKIVTIWHKSDMIDIMAWSDIFKTKLFRKQH
jgi:hypothetical protein